MGESDLGRLIRESEQAEGRCFRRRIDPRGAVRVVLEWQRGAAVVTAEIAVPPPAVEFVDFDFDDDGHAFQRIRVTGEIHALYPILDPFSLEHAVNVEQIILPAVVDCYERRPPEAIERPFGRFHRLVCGVRRGEEAAIDDLSEEDVRLLEIVKSDLGDSTSDEELRRRSLARFYQHRSCESAEYRHKATSSLENLGERLGGLYTEALTEIEERLRAEGFREEPPVQDSE